MVQRSGRLLRTPDIQSAARQLAQVLSAPRDVGALGWNIDSDPRLRVFADSEWPRRHASLPECFAGYRVEFQVRHTFFP